MLSSNNKSNIITSLLHFICITIPTFIIKFVVGNAISWLMSLLTSLIIYAIIGAAAYYYLKKKNPFSNLW